MMEMCCVFLFVAALVATAVLDASLFVAFIIATILAVVGLKFLDVGQRCTECSTPSLSASRTAITGQSMAPMMRDESAQELKPAASAHSSSRDQTWSERLVPTHTALLPRTFTDDKSIKPTFKMQTNMAERYGRTHIVQRPTEEEMTEMHPQGIDLAPPIVPLMNSTNLHPKQMLRYTDYAAARGRRMMKSAAGADQILASNKAMRKLLANPAKDVALTNGKDPLSTVLWTMDKKDEYDRLQWERRMDFGIARSRVGLKPSKR